MKLSKFSVRMPQFTVAGRLRLVLGILVLMLLGGSIFADVAMNRQNEAMRQSYENEMVPSQLASRINSRALLSFITLGEAVDNVGKPALVKDKLGDFHRYQTQIADLVKQFTAVPMSVAVKEKFAKYLSTDDAYQSGITDMLEALNRGDESARDALQMEVRPFLVDREKKLSELIALQRNEAKTMYENELARFNRVRLLSLLTLLAGMLVAVILAMTLSRSIIRTLAYACRVAHEIAEGRLGHDISVRRTDELGALLQAFHVMDAKLVAIVSDVRKGSTEVSTAAQQIARGNDDLSQRTQEQASSLEETASSMEEMTATVKQNAENASQANQLVRGTREQAERGGEVVAQAVSAMSEIIHASTRISEIVTLIDEIAFQTNLLALNAAVEAARAGEQGRGFAVVATEVRNLAQRSATAAKEIKGLIKDSAEKVRNGSALVDQTGRSLAGIVDSVKKVNDIVAEIAAASQEQSAGIDQVNHAVLQMDEMTQQNAALVEQAAAAARAMQEQADELNQQVRFFRLERDVASAPSANDARIQTAATPTGTRLAGLRAKRHEPAATPTLAMVDDGDEGNIWKEF